MALVIHKETVNPGDTSLKLPVGSRLLSTGVQNNRSVVWFTCDAEETRVFDHAILTAGTGLTIHNPPGRFIGTTQVVEEFTGAEFVMHLFCRETTERWR